MTAVPKPAKRGPKPRCRIKRTKRPAAFRQRGSIGKLRKLADDLMSLYVRHKAGWACWVCDSRKHEEMQMAHLYPKGAHPSGRYREDNVRCCCSRCHTYYTHRDAEWTRLLIKRLELAGWEELGQLVDVRQGKNDYVAQALFWASQIRERDDLWKIQERFDVLTKMATKLGVPL